jgi:hypothetical protein
MFYLYIFSLLGMPGVQLVGKMPALQDRKEGSLAQGHPLLQLNTQP